MKNTSVTITLGVVLLALLCFVGAATLQSTNAHAGTPGNPGPVPVPIKHAALPPAQMGLSFMPAPAAGKTLSDGQVKAFVESHPFIGGDTVKGGNPHMVKLDHVNPLQFKKMRNVKPDLPDTEQLVWVEIGGPFHLNRLHAPTKGMAKAATISVDQAYLLIDLQTGNLQGWFL